MKIEELALLQGSGTVGGENVPREPEVVSAVNATYASTEVLVKKMDDLKARLSAVMTVKPRLDKKESKCPTPVQCTLAESIRGVSKRIDNAIDVITDILQDLEI